MSLYDTLQKTKKELPYRFQRLKAEADAKRSDPVTQNSREVSRDQGIRDSYRQRVEQEQNAKDNLENAIQMTVVGYNISPGSSLIQKAVQNPIPRDISKDYFKKMIGDETTLSGVMQKKINSLGDQISKRQNELNERLAEETVSGEPILDPIRNQITSMSQQRKDMKDRLKTLNQMESAMNSSYEQQELLSPDEYKSQVQDLQKQIDTLMEQERVWQDAQYSNALGMEYLGGNVPAQSVQSEIDKLVAQRDKLNALIPEAESVQWENQKKNEILVAGGEDLLRQIMELSRQKQEQEYDNSNYTDYKNAVDVLKSQGYDQKTLDDWFAYAERIRNREEYQKSMEWAQSFAQDHPVMSSLASVPINLASGIGAIDALGQSISKNFTGRPVDYKTPAMQFSGEANTIRGQVASDIADKTEDLAFGDTKFGNAYSTGYQLLMSMADSLGAAGLSAVGVPFSGALLGGSAATNAISEARERGASDGQAIVYGLMAGVAETLFESLSIESLVKLDDPSTVRAAILNILKQGGVEASEELNTSIANTMSDLLVMGPKSQLLTDKRNYLDNGFSQEEASRLAMSNWFNGLMGDALGGFLSGGMMSAFSRPIQSLGQNRNNALDFAIEETMKPTQELDNLNNAIDGLFAQNETAQADTGAESTNVNTNTSIQTPQEQASDAMSPGMDGNSDVMDHGAVGAAESGFSPYSHFQNQTDNFLPEGANAARPVDMPAVDPTGKPVRRGAKTIYGAQTTSDARAEQMENEFMEGLYGYDPVRDKPTLEKAKQTIAQEGYDQAYARVKERLQSMKKLKETGLEAYLLYADAVKNGNDADAAELCLLLTQSGTEFGQGVQLFSMFRKLTPEGQLMGVERLVQRINDKYGDSKKEKAIPNYAWNDVINEITDVRDTALRLLENIHAAFDKPGEKHGVPVENWIAEIGNQLAKTLEKSNGNSNRSTISKTIQNDLSRFARSYFDRSKPGNNYSNAQALENFLNNRDQYTEAWDAARWYLNNKYKDDPTILDTLNDFITSGINIESMSSGIDTDIKKAMNDIGVKTKDIIRKSNADKDSASKQIAEMLMKDHHLSNEDADTMANFIIERFNQHIADASERALKNRFAPKDKKAKKTFEKDFSELANMGAFTNENWKDAVSKKLFGHEISIDENLISEFRNAPDQDSRDAVMEKIYQDIGQKIPTTFAEAANQWRYTAMLLNPSTHIKNMGGNLSMMAMKLGKDAVGAGIETVANAVSGGKVGRTKSILNVFSKSDQALMQKAWADFENVQDDVAGIGKNKDNIMGKVGEYRSYWKLNDPQGNAAKLVDGVLRGAEKVPQFNSNLMEAEDMIFSRPDYAVSLAGYMKANKLTEITPEARAYAIKEAQKATFRDANAVSNFARKMGTGDHKFWNWVASAIFPFKGTPANVGVRALEYSPAGILRSITYDIYRVKKGSISTTEYIDNLSSALTGSALAAIGYYLAQAGFLRATGVGDEKEKEQQRQQGYKDNSFTLLGYSIPETVLTSISAPMFVGAAFYEAIKSKALTGEIYGWDEVFQVLAATADPIFGQTMLDGLSDTFYAIRSAQGGIGETMAALGINTVGNYLSSFMPTILSRISSAADSAGRETYVDKNKPLTGIQKEAQGLMMKTPARQMLHEKVDNYGRVQETWKPFGDDNAAEKSLNFLTNVVTPTYPSKIKDTPVEDELTRLYQSGADTSDKKIFQTEAAKSFKVDGKTINLTADQHEEFEKIRGENTIEYQGALQDSEQYNNLDDSLKIYATDKMYDFIEQTSKDLLGIGYKPADWVAELKGKSNEEIADAVIKKTIDSYAQSDNFSGKYDGITSMLDSGTIDEAMAVSLLPKEANDGYYKHIKGSGIELSTFIDVYQFKNNAKSDKDKDGKTTKSAQEKVIEYINKVVKGPGQKRRMFLAMGYSETNLPEGW